MTSLEGAIIPITLTVNERTGLTLWAPPWEDDDGEEWMGFLGDGAKILLYPNAQALREFIATGEENDLSDHPAWSRVEKLSAEALKPSGSDHYDFDAVYEMAAGDPDPVHVSALANVVDMATNIADCCDDGGLRGILNAPAYAALVDEDNTYQGKDGRKRWNELGDTIAETWERAIGRVDQWLEWVGDFTDNDLESDSIWDRIGAEVIALDFGDATYLTVRGETEDEVLFLGSDGNLAAFTDAADLAQYCRTADGHELHRLEFWEELEEVEDDDAFEPSFTYDLTSESEDGAELVQELAEFCNLDLDLEDGIDDWDAVVAEIKTCLQLQD